MIRTCIYETPPHLERFFLSLAVFSVFHSNSKIFEARYQPDRMSNRTSNTKGNSLIALNFPIFVRQNPHQRCTTISVAKHQHSDCSLKINLKAFKELEKGTPHRDIASLFGVPKNTDSTWKKNGKTSGTTSASL